MPKGVRVRVSLKVQNASVAKLAAREGLKIPWTGMSVSVRVRPEVQKYKQLSYNRLLHHPGTMEIPVQIWTSALNGDMV